MHLTPGLDAQRLIIATEYGHALIVRSNVVSVYNEVERKLSLSTFRRRYDNGNTSTQI